MNKQIVTIISNEDFDNLVSETYGRVYSFQQQDDCKPRQTVYVTVPCKYPDDFDNDDVPEVVNGEEMGVSFKSWLERDPKQPPPESKIRLGTNYVLVTKLLSVCRYGTEQPT